MKKIIMFFVFFLALLFSIILSNNTSLATNDTYEGNINSEIVNLSLVESDYYWRKFISGELIIVEWVNGKSTVPTKTPKIRLVSTDGTVSTDAFVTPTGTNTYYFDRNLAGFDVTKEYYIEVTSADKKNLSPYKSMKLSFANTKYNNKSLGLYPNRHANDLENYGKDFNVILSGQKLFFEQDTKDTYVGNINSELITFNVGKNQSRATYVSGQVVVVEWVNGKSTVPKVAPKMKFKSTDGKVELEVFVTPTGTNTYYFDRFIEGIDTSKQYFFEIESGDANNVSTNQKMNVYFTQTKYNNKIVGKYKDKNIRLLKQNIIFENDTYIGNINSEIVNLSLVESDYYWRKFISGELIIVEWVDGKSTVPTKTPKIRLVSTDGTVSTDAFVTPTGTNTYYFDRNLAGFDVTKEYYVEVISGDEKNLSPYKSMKLSFANTKYNNKSLGIYPNRHANDVENYGKDFNVMLSGQKMFFEKVK